MAKLENSMAFITNLLLKAEIAKIGQGHVVSRVSGPKFFPFWPKTLVDETLRMQLTMTEVVSDDPMDTDSAEEGEIRDSEDERRRSRPAPTPSPRKSPRARYVK